MNVGRLVLGGSVDNWMQKKSQSFVFGWREREAGKQEIGREAERQRVEINREADRHSYCHYHIKNDLMHYAVDRRRTNYGSNQKWQRRRQTAK